MRVALLLAAVPLALLAACGSSDPADEAATADAEMATNSATTTGAGSAAADGPGTTAVGSASGGNAAAADYPGTYTFGEANDAARLTLRDDDTYEYTAGSGEPRTGRFTRLDEGRRILIEDFDGRAGYFTLSDGELYRLPSETASPEEITVTSRYRRENAPVQENGPGATTDSVADKRR